MRSQRTTRRAPARSSPRAGPASAGESLTEEPVHQPGVGTPTRRLHHLADQTLERLLPATPEVDGSACVGGDDGVDDAADLLRVTHLGQPALLDLGLRVTAAQVELLEELLSGGAIDAALLHQTDQRSQPLQAKTAAPQRRPRLPAEPGHLPHH